MSVTRRIIEHMFAPLEVVRDGVMLPHDPRAEVNEDRVVVSRDPGGTALVDDRDARSDEPPADDWWWLFDPLGDAWWDPADAGAEPGIEISPEVEALLRFVSWPSESHRAGAECAAEIAPAGLVGPSLSMWDPGGAEPGIVVDPQVEGSLDEVPWLSASCLAAITPGSGLAGVLERVDLSSAGDELLVETVAAAARQAAFDHLLGALAAGELSRRASMNPLWRQPVPSRTCVAGDELAMRLGWSRPAAARLVRDGRALGAQLLPVADAVRDGLLDLAKLRVLSDRLADRAYQLSWPVLEQVLPDAPTRTPTQLAADIDRALLAIDPLDAAVRLPKALAARHVCHPRRLPDGMAGLWAVLPATDAARIDGTLEATARAARAAGDPRTLDQLRADTLTDLATGTALLAGACLAAGAGVGVAVPGVAGSGPARDAGASTGLSPERVTSPDPDVIGLEPDETGQEPDEVEQELDGAPVDAARPPGRAAPSIRIPKVRIDVTVALSTLMGLDDNPGELAGLGPVPADQARALALGGTWRRIVTDPLTGAVLDVGRTRYRPPAALAEHVLARDQVCAGPGCSVPGHRCDLDHTTEYHGTPANGSPVPGTTSAGNLGPLSSRCHRLKTDGGFTLRQVTPGVFEWRTPAGLAYRVTPGQNGHTQKLDTHHHAIPDNPPF